MFLTDNKNLATSILRLFEQRKKNDVTLETVGQAPIVTRRSVDHMAGNANPIKRVRDGKQREALECTQPRQ
jgi:hypothetical protein